MKQLLTPFLTRYFPVSVSESKYVFHVEHIPPHGRVKALTGQKARRLQDDVPGAQDL